MLDILLFAIKIIFNLLWWAILIRVLLSWLPMANIKIDPYNPVVQALYAITDPILEPLRKFFTIGMMDLSPIIVLVGLSYLIRIL